MEALPFQVLQEFSPIFRIAMEQPNSAMVKSFRDRFPSVVTVKRFPRRVLLQSIGFSPILFCAHPAFAAPLPEMKEPEVIRTVKLTSGVRIQEIIEGEGPEAHEGDLVEVNYVCRRSNGYFVHSTVDQFSGESSPVILPLNENQIIKGLKEVLVGMRVGGKRRALIPPSVGYIYENLQPIPDEFGPRRSLLSHAKEPLIFEVYMSDHTCQICNLGTFCHCHKTKFVLRPKDYRQKLQESMMHLLICLPEVLLFCGVNM